MSISAWSTSVRVAPQRFTAVIEAVGVAGAKGAPGGVIYSALMASGVSHGQFQSIMGALVSAGKLEQSGDLYFVKGAR